MKRSYALQDLRVMQDNLNSLMTMVFAFQGSLKYTDHDRLKHNAKIMVGMAKASYATLLKDKDEILKQLTTGGKRHGKESDKGRH